MIDFSTIYELTDCRDQVSPSVASKRLAVDSFAVARGEAMLPSSMTFVRRAGKCEADVLGTTFASLYLISAHLVDGLMAAGVTGWRSSPVRFEDGTALDGAYHALAIVGRCGRIRYDMSSVVEKKTRAGGVGRWWIGSYFDAETWDGSEMFTPVDTATVFVVSRVREMLRIYDLDGVKPVPLSAVERQILPTLLRH